MSTRLLLTLGPGLESTSHGDVAVVDWASRTVIDHLRYAHRVYAESHKGILGASWCGDRLIVTTEAEVLDLEVGPLALRGVRSFPWFNDVHHACAAHDRIWVCNTGLDCVDEFDPEWKLVAAHDLAAPFGRSRRNAAKVIESQWSRAWKIATGRYDLYSHMPHRPLLRSIVKLATGRGEPHDSTELRYSDLRPHIVHPNHVMAVGGDIWVTLWRTGQVVSLRGGRVLADGLGRPHDGLIDADEYFVTDCQANRVIVHRFDASRATLGEKLRERVVVPERLHGFVRGLAIVGDTLFAGVTARRGSEPEWRRARVLALDRGSLEIRDAWSIPEEFGTGLFSLLDVGRAYP